MFLPSLAFAQLQVTNANTLVQKITSLANQAIGVLIGFAVLYIIFNVVRFIMKADSPEDRAPIRSAILWGIVGLFVITSIWGLVQLLSNTVNLGGGAPPAIPQITGIPTSY